MSSAVAERNEAPWPWWLVLIEGIALVILGILFFTSPLATWATFVWVMGIYWIIIGIAKLIGMFQDHSKWGWKLVLGVLYIIAGIFLISQPVVGSIVFGLSVTMIIGIYAVILGIMSLFAAFKGGGWGAGILGVINIIIGVWLLTNIGAATLALPWVVGIFALIGGVAAIVQAFRIK